MDINPTIEKFIEKARVARLATADIKSSKPHLVPVVFVFDGSRFYIPIDKKKKTIKSEKLKRVVNINENPNVALLIDEYDEDWTKLAFVMIQGKASVVYHQLQRGGEEKAQLYDAHEKLIIKYPQYQTTGLDEMCIVIEPVKVTSWENSQS
jgi:PPOX class probable F420-dependent enzyme